MASYALRNTQLNMKCKMVVSGIEEGKRRASQPSRQSREYNEIICNLRQAPVRTNINEFTDITHHRSSYSVEYEKAPALWKARGQYNRAQMLIVSAFQSLFFLFMLEAPCHISTKHFPKRIIRCPILNGSNKINILLTMNFSFRLYYCFLFYHRFISPFPALLPFNER